MAVRTPDISDGGGGGGYVADTGEIRTAGLALRDLVENGSGTRRYGPLAGVGEAAAAEQAAARFRTAWGTALSQWDLSLRAFGDSVRSVAAAIEDADRRAAEPWRQLRARVPR